MNIADLTALVNQVQSGPIAIIVGSPGFSVIILRYCVLHVQIDERLFQVIQFVFERKLWIVIADDNQSNVFIFVVPFPQRGNYVLAVNSAIGPHLQSYDFAAQVSQTQRRIHIQPDFIS